MSDKSNDLILSKLESMDKRSDRSEEMISTLIQIVGTTNSKVEELQTDISLLKTDVSLLLDNQKTIMQLQQDQQKILERLSIRSISHEADIAEIRRIK
ncbi:hypothetical protein EHS13_12415 [Paenibacillus psychroresistens]|uniref:Uncharacterized protein n=1 Tax=Paenibacillus psychroresistens TaxID=1778678 RepID=A0A6B8RHS7_9BACL|nr:hypothetical protein [Paenibacillus psychroresistens]QGQ95629.1 hypothetical protein EHS13_12415 [Paenibacillus psychroresistens]